MKSLAEIRNLLLTGRERNLWNKHYRIRRCDVIPGLKIIVWQYVDKINGFPLISEDWQRKDSLKNPEKYVWIGQDDSTSGALHGYEIEFMSEPYYKDGHWCAKAKVDGGDEKEVLLFNLGICPDFVLQPKGDDFTPAGWLPDSENQIDRR